MKLHPDTRSMYLNTLKTVLDKENYKKFKEMWKSTQEADELLFLMVRLYHSLKCNKEKFNKVVQNIYNNLDLIMDIERAIFELERHINKHIIQLADLYSTKAMLVIKILEEGDEKE